MIKKIFSTGLVWLWLTIIVFILDRFTKIFAVTYLIDYVPLPVTRFFNLTLSYNTGAAFSFLHQASGWQMWIFGGLAVAISIGILIWLTRISSQQRWLCIALTMIVGGALGNLFDRIYYGKVIDFIQWHISSCYWPTFNIADSAICVGAVMLLWDAMLKQKESQ